MLQIKNSPILKICDHLRTPQANGTIEIHAVNNVIIENLSQLRFRW